ncbi:MAG: SulP family inorganic anion transporter [Pyrinomonadaceae bacterium]
MSNAPKANKTQISPNLGKDALAGLTTAVANVPDGLASAALAGVNPVYGLYTSIAGVLGGSILSSTQLMLISTTSASALTAGQAIAGYPADKRPDALFLLVILVGLFLALFGFLKLGRLVRYISHTVMTGFLIGVAMLLILDQIASLVGYDPKGANEPSQFVDLVINFSNFKLPTIIIGLLSLALVFGLQRTKLSSISSILALIIPTVLVVALGWSSVPTVADASPIPGGLPLPALPSFELLSADIIFSAFALALIIAVQGVGVSQSVENPDGKRPSSSRDLIAQGVANVASGVFSGIPAGGSVGQTALNVSLGAVSRWAGIASAIWMLVIVLLIPGIVGRVPMTALAALMIKAGIDAINVREAKSIWKTSASARWSIITTFVATLVLSIPIAVAIGVLLTVVFFLSSSANDITVSRLVQTDDGKMKEVPPPKYLESETVIILNVEGSLYFAGARTLFDSLPKIGEALHPVIILRLRGYTRVGATLIDVLDDYADDLAKAGGKLYLSGLDKRVAEQLKNSDKLDLDLEVNLFEETPVLGSSTTKASVTAQEWLNNRNTDRK